ncbi:unnamed protein product [Cunninghamella echinulata]
MPSTTTTTTTTTTITKDGLLLWKNDDSPQVLTKNFQPLILPPRRINIDALERDLQARKSTTQFLSLPLYGTSKSLIQCSSSLAPIASNKDPSSKFSVGNPTLKRLPHFQLYSNSKIRRIVDNPSEIIIDIKKFQQEYQQALELKNSVIQVRSSCHLTIAFLIGNFSLTFLN